jgi:hypothetical protein
MCKNHDEPLKYYCTQDKTVVCLHCLSLPRADHKDHNYISVKEAVDGAKADVSQALTCLEQDKHGLEQQIANYQEVLNSVEKVFIITQ